jgi:glutamate synthase domain-containing protein 3
VKAKNDRPRIGPQFPSLDSEILPEIARALDGGLPFLGAFEIRNHNLSVGAHLSGELLRRFGPSLRPGSVHLQFRGPAGQSFGAFTISGIVLELEGEANDGVGKGLSGGEIVLKPYRRAGYASRAGEQVIAGNAVLYGATSGRLFAAGRAGDRFAVRNSGATAVVEGVGAHGCEYMTGGVVVVLGPVGPNFAAGMSNGVAFVLDPEGTLAHRLNRDMAFASPLDEEDDAILLPLLVEHRDRTGSARAAELLTRWAEVRSAFQKVVPLAAASGVRSAAVHEDTEGPDRRRERTRGRALPSTSP